MSYLQNLDNTSVYSAESNHQLVNNTPDYKTLGNYYNKPDCPYQSRPGQCPIQPVYITPSFGGSGYTTLQHGVVPLVGDNNYFTISNAYPAFPYSPCMKPLV